MSEKTKKEKKPESPTPAQKAKMDVMLEHLSKSGGIIAVAAKNTGISRQTHYDWLYKFDTYKKAVADIDEDTFDLVVSKLFMNIQKGKEASIFFFLKTQGKDKGYSERFEIENKEVEEFERVRVIVPDNGRDS